MFIPPQHQQLKIREPRAHLVAARTQHMLGASLQPRAREGRIFRSKARARPPGLCKGKGTRHFPARSRRMEDLSTRMTFSTKRKTDNAPKTPDHLPLGPPQPATTIRCPLPQRHWAVIRMAVTQEALKQWRPFHVRPVSSLHTHANQLVWRSHRAKWLSLALVFGAKQSEISPGSARVSSTARLRI